MSKYDPLMQALERSKANTVPYTFTEIEAVLGFELPKSARSFRPWWSNDSKSHTQARAWLSAGYKATEVNLEGEQVVFRRNGAGMPDPGRNNPIWGCMAGTVTIPENADLTDPAMPEWDVFSGKPLHRDE